MTIVFDKRRLGRTVNPGLMTVIPNKGAGVMGAPVILVPGQGGADANQK
jgi:hypothetical protein